MKFGLVGPTSSFAGSRQFQEALARRPQTAHRVIGQACLSNVAPDRADDTS